MPLAFLKGDILGTSKSTYWISASRTLFSIEAAETIQTICKLIPGSKALSRQLFFASSTHKALLVPRLFSISDSSCSDWLLALDTLHSELLLIAGYTEILIIFGDETLRSNWLLAPMANEASLMPAISFIFHLASTWHDGFLAFITLGGVLIGVAFSAQKVLLFCSKRFVHQ